MKRGKVYDEKSKERLLNIIKTKMKTVMIGALHAVEESEFGDLFDGNDEDAEKWQYVWEHVRNRILNNGNNQMRALEKELRQYTITWNRYEVKLPVFDTREEFRNYVKEQREMENNNE